MTTTPAGPIPLTDTQICIAALSARRTAAKLEAVARPVLRIRGLGLGEYQLLVALVELPGHACRSNKLATRLGLTTGGVSRVVDRALLRGLVTRSKVEGDARGAMITLTPHGADQLAASVPDVAAALRSHLEQTQ